MTDEEIYAIAKPIWSRMNRCSNAIDYEGFSEGFSNKLKETLTKERFESQCNTHKILTSLIVGAEPIACIRREEGYGIIFRQKSTECAGEFMGNLILSIRGSAVEIIDATIY